MTLAKGHDPVGIPNTMTDVISLGYTHVAVLFNDGSNTKIRKYATDATYTEGTISTSNSKIPHVMASTGNYIACFSASHRYTWLVNPNSDPIMTIAESALGGTNEIAYLHQKAQQADGRNGIALCAAKYGGVLAVIDGMTTGDAPIYLTPPGLNGEGTTGLNQYITTVCWRGVGSNSSINHWILGTCLGTLIDCTTYTSPTVTIAVNYTYGLPQDLPGYSLGQSINSIHHHNGWIAVGCADGFIYLINHFTKQVLQRYRATQRHSGAKCQGPLVSRDGDIEMLSGYDSNFFSGTNGVTEWDIFCTPMEQKGQIWLGTWCPRYVGMPSSSFAWAADTSGILYFLTVSGKRAVLDDLETAIDSTNPVTAETMRLSSTDNYKLAFNTPYLPSGQLVPRTSGAQQLLVAAIGKGIQTKFDVTAV